jgi:hypothetical protein
MIKIKDRQISSKNYLGCFGNFNVEDKICKKFCILSVRCAIEHEQISRMEILEDMLSYDENITGKLQ